MPLSRRFLAGQSAHLGGAALMWTVANGTAALLPVQARAWGLSSLAIGWWTAGVYASLVLGTLASRPLLRSVPPTRLLGASTLASSLLLTPSLVDDGRWSLFPARMAAWFCLGCTVATSKVIATTEHDAGERAALLTGLATTGALGAVGGGLISGWILDRGGTRGLSAAMSLGLAVAALLFARVPPPPRVDGASSRGSAAAPDRRFLWLTAATFAIGVAGFLGRLMMPLAMTERGYSAREVSNAAALGALAALPATSLIAGMASEGRRAGAAVASAAALGAGVLLSGLAGQWWVFALAAAGVSLYNYAGSGIVTHLATQGAPDRDTQDARTITLSAVAWVSGLLGYGLGGTAIHALGFPTAAGLFSALAFLAVLVLHLRLRPRGLDELR